MLKTEFEVRFNFESREIKNIAMAMVSIHCWPLIATVRDDMAMRGPKEKINPGMVLLIEARKTLLKKTMLPPSIDQRRGLEKHHGYR